MPEEIFGSDFPFMKENQLLSFDEIERLATIFVSLGVEKIRLSGGEPLLRKNLAELIRRLMDNCLFACSRHKEQTLCGG
jgi:cyclic pyranopterin phosphate synthase